MPYLFYFKTTTVQPALYSFYIKPTLQPVLLQDYHGSTYMLNIKMSLSTPCYLAGFKIYYFVYTTYFSFVLIMSRLPCPQSSCLLVLPTCPGVAFSL